MALYMQLLMLCFLTTWATGSDVHKVGFASATCTFIVSPNGTCVNIPTIPCNTLDTYIRNASVYFQSNSTFCFLPGVHAMTSGRLMIENLSNIMFTGFGSFNQMSVEDKVTSFNFSVTFIEDKNVTFLEPTAVIRCDNSSGFFFNNITQLSLINLTIANCGANVSEMLSYIQKTSPIISISLVQYVSVLMINVSNLHIETTSIQNSTGYGLMGINILGSSVITGSSFVGNNQIVKGSLLLYDPTFTYCNDGSFYIAPRFYVNDAADELYAGGNAVFIYDEISNYSTQPVLNISSCLFALGVDGSILLAAKQKQIYFDPKFKSMGTGLGILMLQNINTVHISISNTVAYRNQAFYGGNLNFQVNQMSSDIKLSAVNSFRGISLTGGGLYYFINPSPLTFGTDPDLLMITNSTFSSDYNYDYFGILIDMSNQLRMNTIVQVEQCNLFGNVVLQSSSLSVSSDTPVKFNNSAFITTGCYGGIGSYMTKSIYSNCSFNRTNIYASQSYIDFIDSSVSNSMLSAFELYYSHLQLTGNVSLFNNRGASDGGALYLYNSDVTFKAPLYSRFVNNTAANSGGAIYAYTKGGNGNCIFMFHDSNGTLESPVVHLYFESNYANVAGNVLYGGDIDRCAYDCTFTPKYSKYSANCPNMTTVLNKTASFVNNGNPSALISSVPQTVCSCTNDSVDCYSSTGVGHAVYPGQTINIPIITVGQLDGISPDVVLSYTCGVGKNCTTPILSDVQQQTKTYCINFTYKVIEQDFVHTFEIVLVPKTAYFNQFGGTLKYSTLVTVHPCPFGFIWDGTSQTCICGSVLQKHNIQCDINKLTVSKTGTLWIGNSSNGALAVHTHCPYDYCNVADITFSLENQDEQCDHNHGGVLCGGCKANLSAVFGSTQCKLCTSHYIWLLIPILLMGVVLMILIFLLNCTVSVGTINGVILYANIVRPGVINLLPTSNLNGFEKFLFVFIDWLNLDLGIETCFYDGMDTYDKTWLQFLFPLYILALVGAIIIGSRWSSKLAWLSKRNAVPVLATLILLSYTKIFQTTITIFSSTKLDTTNTAEDNPPVWLADGNILYAKGKHVSLFIAGLAVAAVFIIPYTSLLFLAPWLQAKSHLRILQWVNKLKPFIDAYQAPFKDQYRYWPGVHLMIRAVLYLAFTTNQANDINVNLFAAVLVLTFYLGMVNVLSVYKNWLLNLLETFFLVNVIFLSAAMLYSLSSIRSLSWVVMISVLIALLVSAVVLAYHVYVALKNYKYFKRVAAEFEDCISRNANRKNTAAAFSDFTDTVKKLDDSMADFYGSTESREPLMEDR